MEFQAIVLAGGTGTRLFPLTEGVVKSMIPVANTPLISYQLHLLERSGFKEAIVATTQAAYTEMGNYLSQEHKGSIAVDMCVVDEELETADVLRAIKDKIKKDFVVVSGDLITDVFVHHLADVHRINDATCTVLLRGPKPEVKPPAGAKPEKVKGAVLDYVGLDPKQSQLLCLESAADVEEKLVLSRKMLMHHPNISITNKMLDAHFYIFSHWVMDLLEAMPELTSIKTELIPFLVKKQYSSKPVPGQPLRSAEDDFEEEDDTAAEEDKESQKPVLPIRCHALVYDGGFCSRADSLHTYKEMNNDVPRHHGHSVPWTPSSSFADKADDEKKALFKKVGSECVVGEGFSIGEKSNIKKSVVGKHCKIGNNVKITNCVIHNHVTIEDNCTITGSVICSNAYLNQDCNVTACHLGVKYNVEEGSQLKNENLVLDS